MKKIYLFFLILFFGFGCLQAKKSSFDLSKSSNFANPFFLFGFLSFLNQSSKFTIGGTITGFTSGTLVLQNNGKDDLTLTAPASQYSFSGISSGTTYSILPKSHPTGLACKIDNLKGTLSANVSNVNITCSSATANALYTLGDATKSYWLDYVKSAGTSPLNASGVACTGTETGFYNACVHAGEFKKVSIPNITTCDGIAATDSLSAFNWKCVVSTDGSVSVISTGLRGDKGLSDLIDFTSPGSFRNNIVTILLNGNSLLTTPTGKWWDNTIVVNNAGGVLGTTKTIYIVTNNSIFLDYRLNSVDKVALVVQKGIIKDSNQATGSVILITSKFNWVEGSISRSSGMSVNIVDISSTAKFTVLRNLNLSGETSFTTGINTNSSSNLSSYVYNTRIANVNTGTNMNSNGMMLNQLFAYDCAITCLNIFQADIITLNSISNNGGNGFVSASAAYSNNLYLNVNSVNNSGIGYSLTSGGFIDRTTYNNALSINNNNGIENLLARFTKYINLISVNTGTQYTDNAPSTNSIFNGIFKVAGSVCSALASPNPGLTASCAKQNLSESSPSTVTSSTFANSFVGKVTSTDSSNGSNTNGLSSGAPSDWFNFSNRFRSFGVEGGVFPNVSNQGSCSTNCRIYDWSLRVTDTIARNVNACPNGSIVDTHTWSDTTASSQAYCDANYKGSKIVSTTCITTFLRNAVEIFADGVGNENGICESGEECMYTPNIGAYQGHSSDATNPYKLVKADTTSTTNTNNCADITTGGTVTNVKLWKYDTNGY